jgi:hypothetical protein
MNRLLEALLFMAGLVMVLGGLGYIEEAPMTLADTLIGAGVSLMGIFLWIVMLLSINIRSSRNEI